VPNTFGQGCIFHISSFLKFDCYNVDTDEHGDKAIRTIESRWYRSREICFSDALHMTQIAMSNQRLNKNLCASQYLHFNNETDLQEDYY